MATLRRPNGMGSIHRRQDGRWVVSISMGYDADGKRKRRVAYAKTKGEAKEKLQQLLWLKAGGALHG